MRRNYLALTMSLTMGIAALSLCACSGATGTLTVSAETISKSEMAEPKDLPMQEDGSVMAKVVSVDDDSLTVILSPGKMDRQSLDGAKPAEGETPPQMPEGESLPFDSKDRPKLSENGETVTVTITSATVITKGPEESADVSDLTADSMIRLVLDEETVVSIHIMEERISE